MRKQWFGDRRDYAKWDFIYREAFPNRFVIYLAMSRPDDLRGDIHPVVQEFFDEYKDLNLVRRMFPGRYCSLLDEYQNSSRSEYFKRAKDLINSVKVHSRLIFIDPDTGIEPISGGSNQHIRLTELQELVKLLNDQDSLIIYQHQPQRTGPTWTEDVLSRLSELSWMDSYTLRHAMKRDCASDVCFIVIEHK